MQCGITCIRMICNYYGTDYDLDTLSQYCPSTSEGVSLLGISKTLTQLGIDTIAVRATIEEFATTSLPCILHWKQKHFVILYRLKKNKYGSSAFIG